MFRLRTQLIEGLREKQIEAFIDQSMAYLRDEVAEAVEHLSDDKLRAFVRKGMESAAKYGIKSPFLLRQYLVFMAWVRPDFDTHRSTPWAAEILNDSSLSPQRKIGKLDDYIMTEWEGAD